MVQSCLAKLVKQVIAAVGFLLGFKLVGLQTNQALPISTACLQALFMHSVATKEGIKGRAYTISSIVLLVC